MKKQKFLSCFWQESRSLFFKDVSILRKQSLEYTELVGVAKYFLPDWQDMEIGWHKVNTSNEAKNRYHQGQ
jgi:hypothetical protein